MAFATPLAFALAALAVPVVVFYILKVRLRRVPVSTNLFWKQIFDEKPPRSLWQYLRHVLSLLAQLLLVTLLVLAVADPYFSWQLLQARRIVAVIDNSASMRADDGESSRFDAAIDAALATVDGLRFRDEMAIVLAGSEPEVVVGMSGHAPTLKRALRSIEISDNSTDLKPAIDLGKRLVAEHPHGQVLVFTDGCRKKAEENNAEPDAAVSYRVFGSADAGNVGITRFQVRRSLIDPLGYEVLVAVRNASSHPVKGRLELELAGSPVDILPLDLSPEGVFARSLEKTSLEGGTLTASLTELQIADDDQEDEPSEASKPETDRKRVINSLATDDRAWAVLPARAIQNVLLITEGNLFLQKVFEANPLVRVTVQAEFPDKWPADGIVVLHRKVPEMLPPGQVFVVDPSGDCDAWKLGQPIRDPIVTEQDEASTLMTHVRLDNVVMPKARALTFTNPPHALASVLSGEAVYAEVKRERGKCLVLTVDINEGDLAFRTAFPIMVANTLGWFNGQTGELRQALPTGSIAEVELADDAETEESAFVLHNPSGDSQPLPVHRRAAAHEASNGDEEAGAIAESSAYLAVPPLNKCGVWSVARAASGEGESPLAELAVNLASDAESDLRTPAELITKPTNHLAASWFSRPLWYYLAAAACLLALVEWVLHQRRVLT